MEFMAIQWPIMLIENSILSFYSYLIKAFTYICVLCIDHENNNHPSTRPLNLLVGMPHTIHNFTKSMKKIEFIIHHFHISIKPPKHG